MAITEMERKQCQKVVEAFKELFLMYDGMCVVDAGNYGFVHLIWFNETSQQFDDNNVYADPRDLFDALWSYWLSAYLLEKNATAEYLHLSYMDMYDALDESEKKIIEKKKKRFLEDAEIEVEINIPEDIQQIE